MSYKTMLLTTSMYSTGVR